MDESKWMDKLKPGVTFLLGLLTGASVVAIVALILYIAFDLPVKRWAGITDVKTETLPPGSMATSKLEKTWDGGLRLVLGIPRGEACPATLPLQEDGESFNPSSVTSDGESIWVGVHEGSVIRINPSNGKVVQEVKLANLGENGVTDMAVAGQDIWALAGGQAYRVDTGRVDTRTNGITQTYPISPTVNGTQIAFDDEDIWIGGDEGSAVRIDPSNEQVVQRVVLANLGENGVTDMAVAGQDIWALAGGQAYKVDTRTKGITQTNPISLTVYGTQIAFDGKNIWVGGDEGSVVRIDPSNVDDPPQEVELANSAKALGLAWDGTYVWVLDTEGCLTRIRASDSQVDTDSFSCQKARVDKDSRIFYEGSYIWVTLDGVLYRR